MGLRHRGAKISGTLLVPLSKALYSNCFMVWRSRKAVRPLYMCLNIYTRVHIKRMSQAIRKEQGIIQVLLSVLLNYTHLL